MAKRRPKLTNLHQGMIRASDFITPYGALGIAQNTRLEERRGCPIRNGTQLIKNITAFDQTKEYELIDLDDDFVAVGDFGSGLEVRAFDEDGAAMTIYQTASLSFNSGGTYEVKVGDTVTGATSGATGVVNAIDLTSGAWAGGDATGTFTIRWTSDPTRFSAGPGFEDLNVGTNLNVATTTSQETTIGFSYLGSDVSKIRLATTSDSVWVVNIDTVIATEAAAAGSVEGDVKDFSVLLEKFGAAVGDIWQTKFAFEGFPAGHYECVTAGDRDSRLAPKWKRVAKPGQDDAVYTKTTMYHQLRRVSGEAAFEWENPQFKPRLSAGDEEGKDQFGNPIIRNPPQLKGRKIRAITMHRGRLAVGLDNKTIGYSVADDYNNWWIDDADQIKPSDAIFDEVVERNTGDILDIVSADRTLFINMEKRQAQHGTRGQPLTAGGTDGPYNGEIEMIGEFETSTTSRPVSIAGVIVFEDAQKNLHMMRSLGENTDFKLTLASTPSDLIYRDLRDETIHRLLFVNRTLYVLTKTGPMYQFVIHNIRRGVPVGGWAKFEHNSERARWVWGDGSHVRLVTDYKTDLSLLKYVDRREPLEAGFKLVARLDRREELTGVYSDANNETTFTTNTDTDISESQLVNRHDLVRLYFDAGVSAIAAGDTITQGDASGLVVRVRKYGDGLWDGDLKGFLTIARTTSDKFVDDVDLKVGTTIVATADGAEKMLTPKGQIITAKSVTSTDLVVHGELGPEAASGVTLKQYVGRTFLYLLQFPTLWNGIDYARLLLRRFFVFHDETSDYDVVVQVTGRADKRYAFTAKRIGVVKHNEGQIEDDFFKVLGGGVANRTTIRIEHQSPGQVAIVGLSLDIDASAF